MFCSLQLFSVNSALLLIHLYETLPKSNTGHLRFTMEDTESLLRRAKISFTDYEGMLFYINM